MGVPTGTARSASVWDRQIPYQLEVMSGHTGTNGWEMQISREGVATSVLSLPLKYMHSPIEVLSLADMEQVGPCWSPSRRDWERRRHGDERTAGAPVCA